MEHPFLVVQHSCRFWRTIQCQCCTCFGCIVVLSYECVTYHQDGTATRLNHDSILTQQAMQEVQAELGGKGGRMSDGNMVKLCSHVLSKRDMSMKGFVLEGWPKTPDQAEQLFTREQPYT